MGVDDAAIRRGLESVRGVPGRFEAIDEGQPFAVIVDYAHTGAAMRKAVEAVREVVDGRLIAVFGCAGERARERRSGLGAAAAELIDVSILTDEDPRSEPSAAIIEEIAQASRNRIVRGGVVHRFHDGDRAPGQFRQPHMLPVQGRDHRRATGQKRLSGT